MNPSRRHFTRAAAALGLSGMFPVRAQTASNEALALHLLDRLGYGPRPGDLPRLLQQGSERHLHDQLHPERLPLPGALQQRLAGLATAALSQRDLVQRYRDALREAKAHPDTGRDARREWQHTVALEAGQARLWRALHSPRQLEEVMVDFWFNHFNVFAGKGLCRVLVGSYERDALRPHALGRFRDLLGATAQHPAMLFYLDNWLSVAPGSAVRRGAQGASGLNENYARELMELHTLGVDGGYTQADVTTLARMLTGWTFDPRAGDGSLFVFEPRRHDGGRKHWLGQPVRAEGRGEGEWALDVLARHPSTARHLARKLAQRFVADAPPPALVDRLARRFLDTDGDIRAVLATLFASAEFRDPALAGTQFKPPYDYLVSLLRAADVAVDDERALQHQLQQLGMPLYGCPTPDGYAVTEAAWLNPEAMTRRVNLANALAAGKLPLGPAPQPVDAQALLATLGARITPRTRDAMAQAPRALQAALVLGSPELQRR